MSENWSVSCSPYAQKVLLQMAEDLKKERTKHPEMNDQEWGEWVKSQIEWTELNEVREM
jgi:hypothetical protein